MKRKLLFVLALMTAMHMPLSASAQTSVSKAGSFQDTSFISGTSLLKIRENSGYAMASLDGTKLTGAIYDDLHGAEGYITASEVKEDDNRKGMFNQDGSVVMEFGYGDIEVLNEHWALGFVLEEAVASNFDYKSYNGESFWLISSVEVYYLNEGTGILAATLTRDQYLEAYAGGNYIMIQDRNSVVSCYDSSFRQIATDLRSTSDFPEGIATARYSVFSENGQQGIVDEQGNVVMAPQYKWVDDIKGDYAVVNTGEKEGLVDITGRTIVPAETDRICQYYYPPVKEGYGDESRGYVSNGYVAVEVDGKIGYYDINGNVTAAPVYSADYLDIHGASATLTDMEGKLHIWAADGTDTVVEGYEDIYALDYTGGILYKTVSADGIGVIDWHGQVIIPATSAGVSVAANGQYLLVEVTYNNQELYQIIYDSEGAAAETTADASEPAAETAELTAETAEPMAETAEPTAETAELTAETAEPMAETAEPEADAAAAKELLQSAIILINEDTAGNAAAVQELLANASAKASSNAAVVSLIDSALSMLEAGEGDAASAAVLLQSAVTLLQ